MSASAIAAAPPPVSQQRCDHLLQDGAAEGALIAVPSAIVGLTLDENGSVSTPAAKLAATGEQLSGCAANNRGRRAITAQWEKFAEAHNAGQAAGCPRRTGVTMLSGATKPKSSHSS